MSTIRFLHCADLHIDSPFKGLGAVHPKLRDVLCRGAYQSFCNMVDVAIAEQVDCVLMAGDTYDAADKSLQAQLRFTDGLRRLCDARIPTFVAHGNRDPLDSRSMALEYPRDVFVFPGDEVAHFPVLRNGEAVAEIYGMSFSTQEVHDNLCTRFPKGKRDLPSIGLLHANVGTSTGHESCAPCTIEDLVTAGLDYWALGHVHRHTILRASNPGIVYPGCSQSTAVGEVGEKGCCLVALERGTEPDIQFVPTDVVRHQSEALDVSDCSCLDDLVLSVKKKCEQISSGMDGRHAMVRLTLTGASDLYSELHRGPNVDDLLGQVREHFEGMDPWIWLEGLVLNTQATYDFEALSQGKHFVADIISTYEELRDDNSEYWDEIEERLSVLFSNWPGQKYLEAPSRDELLDLAAQARDWTVDSIVRNERDEDTGNPY